MKFPYHESYGLPNEHRERVVLRAKEVGPVLASAEFRVGLSTLYKWMKDADHD